MGRNGTGAHVPPESFHTIADADGFFGIRLESIGGLGAHLAGQLLAEAAVLHQGLNGAHFSSYGSEKKGSPLKSYVRFCAGDQDVRTSSPIDRPQVVGIFHEALAGDPSVTAGLGADSTVIVNTTATAHEARRRFGIAGGKVGVVDALGIAVQEGSRLNTAMLGAVVAVCPFIDPGAVRDTIRATFQRKYPHLVDANIRTFERARHELSVDVFKGGEAPVADSVAGGTASYGYLEAPLGGTILTPGNTVLKDLAASRQGFIPIFDRHACVDCGLCDLVCPDFCLVWEEERHESGRSFIRLRGIDYQYCKGCLKCIDACPTLALTEARETDGYASSHTVPLSSRLIEMEAVPKTPPTVVANLGSRRNGAG